jgi:hypothetical protein
MTPISELGLDRLGGYAAANWVRAIVWINIQYIEDLETLSDSELLRVRGIGPKSLHFIRERIAQYRSNVPSRLALAGAQEVNRGPSHRVVIRFDLR